MLRKDFTDILVLLILHNRLDGDDEEVENNKKKTKVSPLRALLEMTSAWWLVTL